METQRYGLIIVTMRFLMVLSREGDALRRIALPARGFMGAGQ